MLIQMLRKHFTLYATLVFATILGTALLVSSLASGVPAVRADDSDTPSPIVTATCSVDDDKDCLPEYKPPRLPHIPQFDSGAEKRIKTKALKALEKVSTYPENSHPVIVSIKTDQKWSVIEAVWAYDDTDRPVPAETVTVLAMKKDKKWQMSLQGTPRFSTWLDRVPENLLTSAEKGELKTFLNLP
jgi:hypothetical protein